LRSILIRHPLCVICCLVLMNSISTAQVDSVKVRQDSSAAIPFIRPDTSSTIPLIKVSEGYHPTKSSLLAVGLSALLPGAGQIYNEEYWKTPVILGLAAYWIYEHSKNDKTYHDFTDSYSASITPLIPQGDQKLLSLRNFYRDERDKFAWYLGALYFLNLLDAYVGANLYDFNVSPDLSLDGRIGGKVTASFRWNFR